MHALLYNRIYYLKILLIPYIQISPLTLLTLSFSTSFTLSPFLPPHFPLSHLLLYLVLPIYVWMWDSWSMNSFSEVISHLLSVDFN